MSDTIFGKSPTAIFGRHRLRRRGPGGFRDVVQRRARPAGDAAQADPDPERGPAGGCRADRQLLSRAQDRRAGGDCAWLPDPRSSCNAAAGRRCITCICIFSADVPCSGRRADRVCIARTRTSSTDGDLLIHSSGDGGRLPRKRRHGRVSTHLGRGSPRRLRSSRQPVLRCRSFACSRRTSKRSPPSWAPSRAGARVFSQHAGHCIDLSGFPRGSGEVEFPHSWSVCCADTA